MGKKHFTLYNALSKFKQSKNIAINSLIIVIITLITFSRTYTTHSLPEENNTKNSTVSSLLTIQFPKHIKNIPQILAYYKGTKLKFNKDLCILSQQSIPSYFTMIITDNVKHVIEGSTVKWLERLPNHPCKIYYINYTGNTDNPWSIEQEKNLESISHRIPYNSLIVLLPAHFVETVYSSLKQKQKNPEKEYSVELPNIVINPKVTEKELQEAQIQAELAALDLNTIHENKKEIVKHQNNTIIYLKKGITC